MTQRSIATRITVVMTAMICLAIALAAVVTFSVYRKMEESMIDKLIQTEANRLKSRLTRFDTGQWAAAFERDMGPSMFAWSDSPRFPATTMPAQLRDLPTGLSYVNSGESVWHVQVTNVMDGRLYVLYDSIVLEQQSRNFAWALAIIVLIFSVIAVLLSLVAARWITSPIHTLTERLSRWAPGKPLQTAPLRNEADRLLEAFNRVQHEVDASIASQREFSENLHHEIRTPLTIIRSDAELMLRQARRVLPNDGRSVVAESFESKLNRSIDLVDEITQSLESTYSLAQANLEVPVTLHLRDCVSDVVTGLHLEAQGSGLQITNQVEPTHVSTVASNALMTVVRNIIRNAQMHAAPATLDITSTTEGLAFTDSGPGIKPQELANVFERYFSRRRKDQYAEAASGSGSHASLSRETSRSGLGLAIAKRVCQQQGWSLTVDSPVVDGKGARFCLTLHQPQQQA